MMLCSVLLTFNKLKTFPKGSLWDKPQTFNLFHANFQIPSSILDKTPYLVPILPRYFHYFIITFFFKIKQPDCLLLVPGKRSHAMFQLFKVFFFFQYAIKMHIFLVLHK